MKKQDVFKKAQTMWRSAKTDQEKYNETRATKQSYC